MDVKICFAIVISFIALVHIATIVTQVFPDTFLSHFCAIRNSKKLVSDYKDPRMQKVRFLDTFKTIYQTGAIFGHMVGFMPVVPLVFANMLDTSELQEKAWPLAEYARKSIYSTQIAFFISGI